MYMEELEEQHFEQNKSLRFLSCDITINMKTSTVSEIHHELLKSLKENYFDIQRYEQLKKALQKHNQTFIGDGLIEFLGDKKGSGFAAQDLVGKLLLELNLRQAEL